jgi:hypothetical protein
MWSDIRIGRQFFTIGVNVLKGDEEEMEMIDSVPPIGKYAKNT